MPPKRSNWKRASSALQNGLVGLITMVSATDLFCPKTGKILCFLFGVLILGLRTFDYYKGYAKPEKQTP